MAFNLTNSKYYPARLILPPPRQIFYPSYSKFQLRLKLYTLQWLELWWTFFPFIFSIKHKEILSLWGDHIGTIDSGWRPIMICLFRSAVIAPRENSSRRFPAFNLIVIVLSLAYLFPLAAQPGANPRGQAAYLEGLDHLESGKWTAARESFSEALEADEENPDYYIARGVALVFAESFKPAIAEFDRALRLSPGLKHARLWKSAATSMQGDFMASSAIYPQATHDQYENQVQDMARLYGEYNFRKDRGETDSEWTAKWKADHDSARTSFPEIARLYTSRIKGTSGGTAPLLADRAAKKIAAGDYASAMKDLQVAAAANPNDLAILQQRAFCNLHLGAPSAARAQYVRVLTAQSGNAEAWIGHALACAALGDARRAEASAENAASLDPRKAQDYRSRLAAALKASPAPSAAKALLADLGEALRQSASGRASDDDIHRQAQDIIRTVNAHRLRADETYLDRRLRLEAAAKANPNSAAALADLGEYLYTQAVSIRGEAVEPRADFATYRPQTDQTQKDELAQAELALNAALKLDPKNVKALTYKAALLIFRLQWSDAETLLKSALAIDPTYGPLLETFAEVMDHAASMKALAALDLRSTESWEDAYYIYYRYPSKAELQLADEYDRQAKALWALAERHLEAAAKNYAGKPLGFYYSGVLAKRRGQAEAARAAFEQCVALTPDYAPAWDELTELYHVLGMKVEAAEAKSAASNLQHTTSGHMLRLAWGQIVRTAYKSAQESLTRAMALDPADPRNYAYMAVIAAGRGDQAGSLAWWRCAAALEEAHAQLNGVSFRASQPHEILTSGAAGRALAINLRLGRMALDMEQAAVAAAAFETNLTIGGRLGKMDRFSPLPTSQLPDQQTDITIIPEADTALSLIAWSHLGMGQARLKQNREQDAVAQFQAVRGLPSQVPPTIDPGNMLADPCVLATINMLKPIIARKEFQQAQQVARTHSHVGRVTTEYGDELRRLTREIEDNLAQQRYDQYDREAAEAMRQRQEEYEMFLKQREEQDRQRRSRTR